jgi:general secretion pathway protein N
MTRIRLPLGRSLFFLSALLFCIVALLPLRLALGWLGLDERGFAAREAVGSVWLGAVREAEFGPVPIGDVSTRLRTLPLLVGRARIDLRRSGEADDLKGALAASRHGFAIEDAQASLDTGAAFAPLPIQGVDLGDVSVHFANGLCVSAEGLVKARVAGNVGGLLLPASFTGDARCEGGALLLPLVSQSGQERLSLRLYDDGRYRLELSLPAGDDPTRQRLIATGFAAVGAAYVLRVQGSL